MKTLDTPHTITGRRHPQTSFQAAARVLGRTGTARRRVLEALIDAEHTDEELQQLLRMPANTQRPRRVELVEDGYVRATLVSRPTASGTLSIVWTATENGRLAVLDACRRGW